MEFRNGSGAEFQLKKQSSNLKVGWNLEQQKCEMGLTAPMPNAPPVSFLDIILTPAYLSILEA